MVIGMNSEYDNENFFTQYAQMPRSKDGLTAAGEWHQLKPLFPELQGKCVLDLGCGYGWHCRFSEEQGAARILGIDLSKRMIEEAERRKADHIPRLRNRNVRIPGKYMGLRAFQSGFALY